MCFVCAARAQGLTLTIDADGLLAVNRTGLSAMLVGDAPGGAPLLPQTETFSLTGLFNTEDPSALIRAEARTDAVTGSVVEGLTVFQLSDRDAHGLVTDAGSAWVIGSDAANQIEVRGTKNLIDAGAGDDVITVAAASTTVVGGTGADQILVGDAPILWSAAAKAASVVVLDFNRDEGDRLDLSGLVAALDTPGAGLSFAGANSFSGVAGSVRYQFEGFQTQVLVDLDGDAIADFRVDLIGTTELVAEDLGLAPPSA